MTSPSSLSLADALRVFRAGANIREAMSPERFEAWTEDQPGLRAFGGRLAILHAKGEAAMTPLEHAISYARQGWPVFPCDPATKKPLTEHGHKDATH